ncbi:MAG: DUF5615 family PIN-like protein [Chloroflexi bacterium]|nr:DUF5615 family PIN-like protein [Chloroflexota bacterium]
MARLRVYLDQCVDLKLAQVLQGRGYWVITAAAAGTLDAGDDEQLAYATGNGLLIVTHNGKHFWALHQRFRQQHRHHGGIVVLPQRVPFAIQTLRASMMLDWIGTLPASSSEFFTWGSLQEELEKGYRLPGYSEDDVRLALGRQAIPRA